MYQHAIVRTPSSSIIHGLASTTVLGKPHYEKALKQHQDYIDALISCGVQVNVLEPVENYPDSCFVEDAALLTKQIAIGAISRQGEVALIEPIVRNFYQERVQRIEAPGTLEAGDVLYVEDHFYIGISKRTTLEGAHQLTSLLARYGYKSTHIELKEFLHLKTGVSYLGKGCLLVNGELINHPAFKSFQQVIIDDNEAYAANCIMVNNTVIMPKDFNSSIEMVRSLDFKIITVDVSEFRKIDGGLSCLSLRF